MRGRLTTSFLIGPTGRPTMATTNNFELDSFRPELVQARATAPVLEDRFVAECVRQVMQTLRFEPPSRGRGVVSVGYPFYFDVDS